MKRILKVEKTKKSLLVPSTGEMKKRKKSRNKIRVARDVIDQVQEIVMIDQDVSRRSKSRKSKRKLNPISNIIQKKNNQDIIFCPSIDHDEPK